MLCALTLVNCYSISFPLYADDSPPLASLDKNVNFKGYYEFYYGGLRFGKMGIELEQAPASYAISSDIATTGLVKFLVPHQSHTTVDGRGKDFRYSNVAYESNYQTRNKKKYVKMDYANGVPTETLVPPENPKKRPPVPLAYKKDSADPLSFLLQTRQVLHDTLEAGGKEFAIKYYDGRRLTLVKMAIEGHKTIAYGTSQVDTIRISMRRQLLAGHTPSEIEDFSPKEPVIYAHFSNDSRFMPLQLEVKPWYGTLTAELVKECRTGESCLFGLK